VIKAHRTAIIFGKGRVSIRAAELVLQNSYDLLFVVPSSPELPEGPTLAEWATSAGVEVRRPASLDLLDLDHADIGISVFYDRIFRQRHIDRFTRLINLHNSLLPKYRGVRPINWALKNREVEHGVTLHEITPGVDEGAILAQMAYAIHPDIDEVRDVYKRAISAAESLLEVSIPRLDMLTPLEQDESAASYYAKTDDERLGNRRYWTRDYAYLV
jgi:methionyl-tRNA formyltransferase